MGNPGGNQQTLLDAIAALDLEHRRSPTVRELATAMAVGVTRAHTLVRQAALAGVIEYEPGIPRSIRVAGSRCAVCGR